MRPLRPSPSTGSLVSALVLVVVTVTACGAPSGSPARTIGSVPYDLTATATPTSPVTRPTPTRGAQVFLVRDDTLAPASAVTGGPDTRSSASTALERLVDGPTERDRATRLSTALGPELRLSLTGLSGGRATVDVRVGEQALGAGRLPLVVGQIVLTLTSVTGVEEVLLTAKGTHIAAPLPGGALTDRPLRARDYAELLTSPTPTVG